MSWPITVPDRPRRRATSKQAPALNKTESAFLGIASALTASALAIPLIAMAPLTRQFHAPSAIIVAIAAVGFSALALALWRLTVRGGMISRRNVVAMWLLSAAGLTWLALLPDMPPTIFAIAAGLAMAAVGYGGAAGYMVQANVLMRCAAPGYGAAEIRPWEVITKVALTGGAGIAVGGVVVTRLDWRWACLGLAVAVTVYAVALAAWRGMPGEQRTARGSVRAVYHQAPDLQRTIANTGRLYAVWQLLPALPALMGADPVYVALLAAGPPVVAALWMPKWGRLAEEGAAMGLRWGSLLAAFGVLALPFSVVAGRSFDGLRVSPEVAAWGFAFAALCLAEVGLNAGVPELKGNLVRRGYDPVRQQLTGQLVRFACASVAGWALSAVWWVLQPLSTFWRTAVVVVFATPILFRLYLESCSWRPPEPRPGKHPDEGRCDGRIALVVLPVTPGSVVHWFAIRLDRDRDWRLYDLVPRELLEWTAKPSKERGPRSLFDLRALPLGERLTGPPVTEASMPMTRRLAVPRGLTVHHDSKTAGTLVSRIHEEIRVTATTHPVPYLPEGLPAKLGELRHKLGDLDWKGVAGVFELVSEAFRGVEIEVRSVHDRSANGNGQAD